MLQALIPNALEAIRDYHVAETRTRPDSSFPYHWNLTKLSNETINFYDTLLEGDSDHELIKPIEAPLPVQTISPNKPVGSKIGNETCHFSDDTLNADINSKCLFDNSKHQYMCPACPKRFNDISHFNVH